ncbi:MAG: amidohydrolase family protein [Candidatus Hydrogenedentota bacterium]
MDIELFDVQTGFGGAEPGNTMVASAEDLLAEMARLDIARALVREVPDTLVNDVPRSNEKLYEAHARHSSLVPCPLVVPATGYDLPPEKAQIDAALDAGAGAVAIRPAQDHWSLEPWCCDRLFQTIEERRTPVFCLNDKIPLEALAGLARRYPEIPFILAGIGYRTQRIILPMMETFPNIYLSVGSNMSVHQGLDQLVAKIGAPRMLFGTGFPQIEAMCGVTLLMYAGIPDEAKTLIGAGNLARLINQIRR